MDAIIIVVIMCKLRTMCCTCLVMRFNESLHDSMDAITSRRHDCVLCKQARTPKNMRRLCLGILARLRSDDNDDDNNYDNDDDDDDDDDDNNL